MRASRFAQRGWVNWLPPSELSKRSLATAVLDALDQPVGCAGRPPDLLGRQRAALHLLNGGAEEVAEAVEAAELSATGSDDLLAVGPQLLGKV
jgi:hypothetical protein